MAESLSAILKRGLHSVGHVPWHIQLRNCGDWNGEKAAKAYDEGDLETYARLIAQADRLWEKADRLLRRGVS